MYCIIFYITAINTGKCVSIFKKSHTRSLTLILGGSWQTNVLMITIGERYHNSAKLTDRLTLAPGSRARMDLAAANEAVPPPISR